MLGQVGCEPSVGGIIVIFWFQKACGCKIWTIQVAPPPLYNLDIEFKKCVHMNATRSKGFATRNKDATRSFFARRPARLCLYDAESR